MTSLTCPECGNNGCVPADDSPTADPVRCGTCGDPPAERPAFRGSGDMARHDPHAFFIHQCNLAGVNPDEVNPDDWDDPACDEIITACGPDDAA